jgi:hypothetical protein
MSRLHEPLQQHIHADLCGEVNNVIIAIKLNHVDLSEESAIQQAKISEARKHHPEPTWQEMIDLLTRVRDEMNECKIPFKRY